MSRLDYRHQERANGGGRDAEKDRLTKVNAGRSSLIKKKSQRGESKRKVDWGYWMCQNSATRLRTFEDWEISWNHKEKRGRQHSNLRFCHCHRTETKIQKLRPWGLHIVRVGASLESLSYQINRVLKLFAKSVANNVNDPTIPTSLLELGSDFSQKNFVINHLSCFFFSITLIFND